ncbi:MAG: hypothetical protein GYA45_07255 [Pelolinea sp.]|jgi:hypothetical protein|nr:hypothetical protein [Pelolinea sp.]
MKRKNLEVFISLLFFIALWIGLSFNTGGPIYSDELLYIEIGLNNQSAPNYGNRYFHVYLQKLFMAVAPTPLIGIRVYWAFMIALTTLLVYWSARIFLKESSPLHGLLGVAIFLSYKFLSSYAGVTSVDIAAMMMTMALIFTYLLYQRTEKKGLLYLLGALTFLAFKTKETTLFANVVLLGFFFDKQGKFAFKNILPILKSYLIGFLGAIGLFILLDSIFLGQPFFAISPATIKEVFENYAYTGGFRKEPVDWYQTYLLDDIMIPFLLFVVTGVKLNTRAVSPQKKILWAFPLLLVSFITLNMLKIPWGFIERFYFPALPVIAFLAPQFISIPDCKDQKSRWQLPAAILAALLLVVVMRQFGMRYVTDIDWTYGKYLESIYFPILLSVLLGLVILAEKQNLLTFGIILFFLVSWVLPKLSYNYKYIYVEPTTNAKFQIKYYPFLEFQQDIAVREDVKMYTTATIFSNTVENEDHMFSDNPYDILGMYDVLFNMRTERDNLTLSYKQEDIPEQILAERYDFMILSTDDWQYLQDNYPEVIAELSKNYTSRFDEGQILVFLVPNS